MANIITRLGNGWYNFEKLDQSQSYIKIHNLNSQTDRKAVNAARKILGNSKAVIEIKEE